MDDLSVASAKGRCFVIMPFSRTANHDGTYWTRMFEKFIKPSVEALGYQCYRSTARPGSIISGIIDDLFTADVVLAVLTDNNPNVWYELGVRHSLRLGTIMVIEKGQKIPFDVAHYGCVRYNRRRRQDFQDELSQFVQSIGSRERVDSPVISHLDSSSIQIAQISSSVVDSPLTFEDALDSAQESVLIVGQNLYSLASDKRHKLKLFETLESKAIAIQLLVCDTQRDDVVKVTGDFTGSSSFARDLFTSVQTFSAWKTELEEMGGRVKGRLELAGSDRVGNISVTFVDPRRPGGRMLITPTVWTTLPTAKPCVWISKQSHSKVFQHYFSLYETIWRHARVI